MSATTTRPLLAHSPLLRSLRAAAVVAGLAGAAVAAQAQAPAEVSRPAGGGAQSTSSNSNAGAPFGAPEIDPTLATAAVALVVGGALILIDRRRRARAG